MSNQVAAVGAPGTTRSDISHLLRSRRLVPAWNQTVYERNVNALEASKAADKTAQVQALKAIFDEFAQGRAASVPDQAPVPTRIRQQIIGRIHSRVLSQMWALDYCQALEMLPGEELAYRVQGVKLPSVYKLGAPGGNWTEVHRNQDGYYTLGRPSVYSIPEIWIPRWNPLFPDRYLEDILYVADVAGMAMAEQMEGDAVSAVNEQFVASGMRSNAFDYISTRVQAQTIPDTNIIAPDILTGKVDVGVYKALGLHAMKLNRRISRMDMAPDSIATMWDALNKGTEFADFPEVFRAALMSGGEGAYTPLFGMNFPQPQPNNSIDISGESKYFYSLLEPSDPMAPRGACWMYTWPQPQSLGESGEAYVLDSLQYLRSVGGARVYDVFTLQKNALFAKVAYQQPNVAKVQYAPAAGT